MKIEKMKIKDSTLKSEEFYLNERLDFLTHEIIFELNDKYEIFLKEKSKIISEFSQKFSEDVQNLKLELNKKRINYINVYQKLFKLRNYGIIGFTPLFIQKFIDKNKKNAQNKTKKIVLWLWKNGFIKRVKNIYFFNDIEHANDYNAIQKEKEILKMLKSKLSEFSF